MLKKSPLITIIILNYNSTELTKNCINSLNNTLNYKNYNIILVDNSNLIDFSKDYLKQNHIIYIKNPKNLGFAKGCNIGIKHAYNHFKPQYYWLLNNDTLVTKDSLTNLVNYAKNHHIAITGSKIINPKNNQIQCLAGGYLHYLTGKSYFIKNSKNLNKLQYICGASMLINNNTIEKIGYLDEDFFLYYEDNQYCMLAKQNNLKIGYANNSIIYHTESSTTNKIPCSRIFFTTTSFIIFCRKNKKYLTCFNGLILRFCFFIAKLKLSYIKNFFRAIYIGLTKKLSK